MIEFKHCVHPKDVKRYTTQELRESFHSEKLFKKDELNMVYSYYDRFIFGQIMPVDKKVELSAFEELRSASFHERRESGVINFGGKGKITVDGEAYELEKEQMLYIGRGAKEVVFESLDGANPAMYYLNSTPAHKEYPTKKGTKADANQVALGSSEACNERVIYQFIHENGIRSCQLVMGFTELKPGSVWNTFPPHTHGRRMEVYCYFDMPEDNAVLHIMGEKDETRHIFMRNYEAVISPSWSMHSGAGSAAYKFVWGMAGENQSFTDMDHIKTSEIL